MKNYEWKCPKCDSTQAPIYTCREAFVCFHTSINGKIEINYSDPDVDADEGCEWLLCSEPDCGGAINMSANKCFVSEGGVIIEQSACGVCGNWIDFEDEWSFEEGVCRECSLPGAFGVRHSRL